MPPDESYWCQYAVNWAEMLQRCESPPVVEVEVWEALGTATGEHKPEPTEEPENSVYGSCEEAEEAGEQRVQGSRGGGQEFPKAMVPSTGDGDGDGVVCER